MALKITYKKGIFVTEGTINAMTALNFKNHIEAAIRDLEDLVINIENVTEIDTSGMEALRSIYASAIACDKKFYVVGTGCKEVYDDLYLSSVA
ncbi:STAS domain-containing protein [Flavivirga jejuensis]|uniref:STAS domain-containing protein n=1 Tax=Flavivirga jejuensis TaxID=870487 RepID=A0ABT8WPP0_9FLAO|nr:STAS domain-containing protein [Flavivirga jejuensis]MDO5975139.1 STAS domain-containing protein [Flavivirga jejuensis]